MPEQPAAGSQVVSPPPGEVPVAPGRTGTCPPGGVGRAAPSHLGRERAGEIREHRLGGWKDCARSVPAKRPVSSASSPATTIHREGRRCSSPACGDSPSCLSPLMRKWAKTPRRRSLSHWPPCAGGPAGASSPATSGMRPHSSCPAASKGGEGGGLRLRPAIRRCFLAGGTGWTSGSVHHALAHTLPSGRREGRTSRLTHHPGQAFPRSPPNLGPEPPPVPQERHRGGIGPSSHGGG